MPRGINNVNDDHDILVIQMHSVSYRIGGPTIETDVGAEIVIRGYAAAAARLLIDANGGFVHASMMHPDAPARLHQAGVKLRADPCPQFGTGNRQCWLRFDSGLRARIVREIAMEAA